MNEYIIEGTITELTTNKDHCIFKINGTEGYSVKHDKKKYNVLYSENIKSKTSTSAISTFVLYVERKYKTQNTKETLLAAALTSGKKMNFTIEAEEKEIITGSMELSVTSITLLSE